MVPHPAEGHPVSKSKIHIETIDGVVHLSTVYRGVEYLARAMDSGWEVQSHRLALGAQHSGMVRRFASTEALATGLRAFASFMPQPSPPPESHAGANALREALARLRAQQTALAASPDLLSFARKKVGPALLPHIAAIEALDIPESCVEDRTIRDKAVDDVIALIGRWQWVRSLIPPGSVRA